MVTLCTFLMLLNQRARGTQKPSELPCCYLPAGAQIRAPIASQELGSNNPEKVLNYRQATNKPGRKALLLRNTWQM